MIAVLLAGGSGTRFWPLSRELHPKQFLNLNRDQTLIQATFTRLQPLIAPENIFVVTHQDHAYQTCLQLAPCGFDPARLLVEPVGCNTAPAVALAARFLESRADEVMAVFPADHMIQDTAAFQQCLKQAESLARRGYLTALGITPTRPETGYGYLRCGQPVESGPGFEVERFVEKPDAETARSYLKTGGYYWNSGIYLWTVGRILEEIAQCLPALDRAFSGIRQHCVATDGRYPFLELDAAGKKIYAGLERDSIDYAVLEKTDRVAVVPAEMGWSDVGAWDVLGAFKKTDDAGNVVSRNVLTLDCSDNIIHGDQRLIAALGVDSLIVVDTPDAVLVCRKERAQDVKKLVEFLRAQGREEVRSHTTVDKPWGSFTTLIKQPDYLVKRIDVLPGHQLSLQSHAHRGEHWVVVSGTAEVELEGETFILGPNESTYIPQGAKHRLSNTGPEPLVLVEIQTGSALRENDITRYDDAYGRAGRPNADSLPRNKPAR